jgi:hypothetical protein
MKLLGIHLTKHIQGLYPEKLQNANGRNQIRPK